MHWRKRMKNTQREREREVAKFLFVVFFLLLRKVFSSDQTSTIDGDCTDFSRLTNFFFVLFLYRFIFLEKESERIRINKRREDDYRRLILPKNKSYNIFLVTYTHTYTYTHTHIKMALKRINKVSSPFFVILVLEP